MSNELANNCSRALSTVATTVNQNGPKNMHIDNVGTVHVHNTLLFPQQAQRQTINVPATQGSTNQDYYNLFVIGTEAFDSGHFIVPKDRALTESITDELKFEYASLSDHAIAEIKRMPAIFTSEKYYQEEKYQRRNDGYTDAEHQAILGLVTDIKIQENGIKIYYHIMLRFPQQILNERAFDFAIKSASAFNELNRTHWTIKHINVLEELKSSGIGCFI